MNIHVNICLHLRWYIRDDNAMPPTYQLQPINSVIPQFGARDPAMQKAGQEQWWQHFDVLQSILERGAKRHLRSEAEVQQFIMSGQCLRGGVILLLLVLLPSYGVAGMVLVSLFDVILSNTSYTFHHTLSISLLPDSFYLVFHLPLYLFPDTSAPTFLVIRMLYINE